MTKKNATSFVGKHRYQMEIIAHAGLGSTAKLVAMVVLDKISNERGEVAMFVEQIAVAIGGCSASTIGRAIKELTDEEFFRVRYRRGAPVFSLPWLSDDPAKMTDHRRRMIPQICRDDPAKMTDLNKDHSFTVLKKETPDGASIEFEDRLKLLQERHPREQRRASEARSALRDAEQRESFEKISAAHAGWVLHWLSNDFDKTFIPNLSTWLKRDGWAQPLPKVRRDGDHWLVEHGTRQYDAWLKFYMAQNSSKTFDFPDRAGHVAKVKAQWPPQPRGD